MRAVTEVEVFGQRVGRPAAGRFQAAAPPDAAGAVEWDQPAAAIARRLLNHEMRIDGQALGARQAVFAGVEVAPAALHDADFRVGEQVGQRTLEEVGRRQEVGIEYGDILAFAVAQAFSEGAGFEAVSIGPADMLGMESARFQFRQLPRHQLHGQVVRIVQHLYQQFVARVVKSGDRVDQAAGDSSFVVQRQLNGDVGKIKTEAARWMPRGGSSNSAKAEEPAPPCRDRARARRERKWSAVASTSLRF